MTKHAFQVQERVWCSYFGSTIFKRGKIKALSIYNEKTKYFITYDNGEAEYDVEEEKILPMKGFSFKLHDVVLCRKTENRKEKIYKSKITAVIPTDMGRKYKYNILYVDNGEENVGGNKEENGVEEERIYLRGEEQFNLEDRVKFFSLSKKKELYGTIKKVLFASESGPSTYEILSDGNDIENVQKEKIILRLMFQHKFNTGDIVECDHKGILCSGMIRAIKGGSSGNVEYRIQYNNYTDLKIEEFENGVEEKIITKYQDSQKSN